MAREEEGRTLPEDMVEKIISMLPFPSMFKARCLSKSWLARLSPISSQQDDSTKCLAVSFQKQASQWSHNWRTFCPVYVNADTFTAYNRVSGKWLKLPSLSYLCSKFLNQSTLQIEGPLFYGFGREVREVRDCTREIYVANVLTGRWKLLPSLPKDGNCVFKLLKLVIGTDVETYKVILVCHQRLSSRILGHDQTTRDLHKVSLHIYDSASDAWSEKAVSASVDLKEYVFDAYLNGVLYIAKLRNSVELVAIDVNKGVLDEINFLNVNIPKYVSANLLVHNSCLFMVLHLSGYARRGSTSEYRLNLLKIDLVSQSLSTVAEFVDKGKMYVNPVSDGDRLFFLGYKRVTWFMTGSLDKVPQEIFFGCHVMEYNFHQNKFTFVSNVPPSAGQEHRGHYTSSFMDRFRHRWVRSSFQPGLSPFVAV